MILVWIGITALVVGLVASRLIDRGMRQTLNQAEQYYQACEHRASIYGDCLRRGISCKQAGHLIGDKDSGKIISTRGIFRYYDFYEPRSKASSSDIAEKTQPNAG